MGYSPWGHKDSDMTEWRRRRRPWWRRRHGLLGVRVGADRQTGDTRNSRVHTGKERLGTDESNGKQVQSSGWRAFPAGGLGAVPGRGPEIPQAA